MSHELRTPLNAVIGYSQMLRDDAVESGDPQMQEDVERIHEAGHYLLRLINIILDLSKIEAGRMQFTVQPHALTDLIHEAVDKSLPAFNAKGNTLAVSIEAEGAVIHSDGPRLTQILGAVSRQHSDACACVHASCAAVMWAHPCPQDAVEITVRDFGAGIAPDRLATLFESLADKRDAAASKYGGTGLSLTIMNKQALAMAARCRGAMLPEGAPHSRSLFRWHGAHALLFAPI